MILKYLMPLIVTVTLMNNDIKPANDVFAVSETNDDKLYNFLLDKIASEASEQENISKVCPVLIQALNKEQETVGGIAAYCFYGSLLIDVLWVDKRYRNKGIGKALIEKAETIAKKNSLKMISVCTMEFWNNLDFYKKLGFEIEFIKLGFINNFRQYHLVKKIDNDNT